jgi:choline dehydrogenase-like flavoprotein
VPNFSRKYRAAIEEAPNITLFTHANVTQINAAPSAAAIQSVRVQSFTGKTAVVKSRFFVVCCGGIETARLLLLSRSVEPNGIGNAHDVVGRFFQDHPGVSIGMVRPLDKRFRKMYDSFRCQRDSYGWVRHALKVYGTPEWLRSEGLLNICAEMYYPDTEDNPVSSLKTIARNLQPKKLRTSKGRSELASAVGNVVTQPQNVVQALWQKGVLKQPVSVGVPNLGIGCEQEPNPQSRVSLSDQTDSLGMPRTVLEWRLSGSEIRTIERFVKVLASEWKRLGLADVGETDVPVQEREHGKNRDLIDASHHIGTTRMGDDPKTSVTDSRCRVHGYDNLYIGGSSLFPTGGFSNPTLTAIALCLRTSDELKDRLRAPLPAVE